MEADFVAASAALSGSHADPAARAAADAWLRAFRESPEAWEPLQRLVEAAAAAGGRGVNSAATLHAAQLLSYKIKHQLQQLPAAQSRAALAERVTTALVALAWQAPVARALCVSLANLAIQCTDWMAPLDAVGEPAAVVVK